MRRVTLLLWILLLGAGCATTPPTEAPSPLELTRIRRTVLAINVQQTLDAQATRNARTPLNVITTAPPLPTFTPRPTFNITLTFTPTPTTAPTSAATATAVVLPEMVAPPLAADQAILTLSNGFFLQLDGAETREQAGPFRPQGQYVVFLGTFVNQTSERQCTYSRQIRLAYGGDQFVPFVEGMAAIKPDYGFNYPGPINGQCISAGTMSPTFILFDLPVDTDEFTFRYNNQRLNDLLLITQSGNSFDVRLQP